MTESCGYSIPYYQYISERKQLKSFSHKLGIEGIKNYGAKKNSFSIDGLPSLGQFEMNQLPDSIEYNGYYFASYNNYYYGQLQVWLWMKWRYYIVNQIIKSDQRCFDLECRNISWVLRYEIDYITTVHVI
jgi:hypothetical protein